MFLLIITVAIIVAFITIPFVYFLADEQGKRYFAMFYGLIILVGGGYAVLYTLFGAVVLLLDFGGSYLSAGNTRSSESSLKLTLWAFGLLIANVLLYFAACLVDPGPEKRFLQKRSSQAKSE